MEYRGMSGTITLGTDRMSVAIREELDLPACDVNLTTCEAYVPTGHGSQTRARRLSVMELAPTMARTPARRKRFGVTVTYP